MNYFDLTKGSYKEKRNEFKNLYVAKIIKDKSSLCLIFGILFLVEFALNTYLNNDFDVISLVFVALSMISNICFEQNYENLFREYVNGYVKEK